MSLLEHSYMPRKNRMTQLKKNRVLRHSSDSPSPRLCWGVWGSCSQHLSRSSFNISLAGRRIFILKATPMLNMPARDLANLWLLPSLVCCCCSGLVRSRAAIQNHSVAHFLRFAYGLWDLDWVCWFLLF